MTTIHGAAALATSGKLVLLACPRCREVGGAIFVLPSGAMHCSKCGGPVGVASIAPGELLLAANEIAKIAELPIDFAPKKPYAVVT